MVYRVISIIAIALALVLTGCGDINETEWSYYEYDLSGYSVFVYPSNCGFLSPLPYNWHRYYKDAEQQAGLAEDPDLAEGFSVKGYDVFWRGRRVREASCSP